MAKVSIKYEKITLFGGIFHVRELFSRFVGPVIDKVLGLRCTSFGYQYGEIAGSLASVYFCGGDCVEDVTSQRFGQNRPCGLTICHFLPKRQTIHIEANENDMFASDCRLDEFSQILQILGIGMTSLDGTH